mgnify:FL=1
MDPITLATVTAALTVLATECSKGAAKEVGEDLWTKAKSLLGWKKQPATTDLASAIAEKLHSDQDLMREMVKLLQQTNSVENVSALVQNVSAKKLVIIKDQTVNGDFNLKM